MDFFPVRNTDFGEVYPISCGFISNGKKCDKIWFFVNHTSVKSNDKLIAAKPQVLCYLADFRQKPSRLDIGNFVAQLE